MSNYTNKDKNSKSGSETNRNRDSRNGSNNKRPNKRDKRYPEKDDACKDSKKMGNLSTKDRDNDPNWYFTDSQLADQVSAFSFDSYLGVPTKYNYTKMGTILTNYNSASVNVPSILTMDVNPSPGNADTIQTGINMASLKNYTMLSSINAKTTNYAPQDLTTLMLALGEVISILEHLRRCFGVAFTYNQRNRDLPVRLLTALNMEPKDFLKNIAQYRLQFNSMITAVNKIPFLDNIAYMYKCADLFQKVYLDSDSPMAQIVLTRPYSTWVIDETYSEQGTGLRTTKLVADDGIPLTWNDWSSQVTNMITQLFESTTYNYIYSDILNYSTKVGAKLLYMDYLVEGYSVVPEYNRNYMLQVHNANAINAPQDTVKGATGQTKFNDVAPSVNTNTVSYNPLFWEHFISDQLFIDMDVPEANVVDRIEATRFQSILQPYDATGNNCTGYALPDHYVVRFHVYSTDQVAPHLFSMNLYDMEGRTGGYTIPFYALTQFDWAPIMIVTDTSSNDSAKKLSILGDVNYYTTLPKVWYYRTNDIVFQSLFMMR